MIYKQLKERKKRMKKYVLGIDIGITSVGYGIIDSISE